MNNEKWIELDFIFQDNEDIAKDHAELAEIIKLIHESINLQKQNDDINKRIQELNVEKGGK